MAFKPLITVKISRINICFDRYCVILEVKLIEDKPGFLMNNISGLFKYLIVFSCLVASSANLIFASNLDKYNVLFILVDDLRPQLGCYGDQLVKSPTIDSLSNNGVTFDRAYCSQAICYPSRASMLSGLRPTTTNIINNGTRKLRDFDPNLVTLPQAFKNQGYLSYSFGKVFHKSDISSWSKVPIKRTNDPTRYRGYFDSLNIAIASQNSARKGNPTESLEVDDTVYTGGWSTMKAIEELRSHPRDKNFFMAMGYYKPHLPFVAPKKYWDIYDFDSIAATSLTELPLDMPPIAMTNSKEMKDYPSIGQKQIGDSVQRHLIHGYLACISYVDAQINKLMNTVRELGYTDNTIVVFWGDHGFKLGEYGAWSKHTNFEIDTRVPLLFSVPNNPYAGTRVNTIVESVDIYPTLCDLVGIKKPDNLDGLSFSTYFGTKQIPWNKPAYSIFPKADDILGHSIRTPSFRYTQWVDQSSNTIIDEEFYDHKFDSLERFSLAKKFPNNEQLVSARETLRRFRESNGSIQLKNFDTACHSPQVERFNIDYSNCDGSLIASIPDSLQNLNKVWVQNGTIIEDSNTLELENFEGSLYSVLSNGECFVYSDSVMGDAEAAKSKCVISALESPYPKTKSLEIYPNPSTGTFNFYWDSSTSKKLTISIFGQTGLMVSRKSFMATRGENKLEFNNLKNGIYYTMINDVFEGKQCLSFRKLMVNH